ncbi:MAG: sulfatase-like hydrolase/transferase [Porticoccus sp.]
MSNSVASQPVKKNIFGRYAVLVLVLLLAISAVNFYQILLVTPDTIGMKAFTSAMFSSPGFLYDLLWFVLSISVIHIVFIFLLWLGSVGWMTRYEMPDRQFSFGVFGYFLGVCTWVLIWSARQYPNMPSGFIKHNELLISDAAFYSLTAGIAISFVASLYLLSHSRARKIMAGLIVTCAVALGGWVSGEIPLSNAKLSAVDGDAPPNIIILGIDSLRPDETGFFGSDGELTPNIDKFLSQSRVYSNAYTPFARTFPAWMSLLTGKEPVNHKARFNLINHSYLDKKETIGWWLKDRGYRTIYGFDERRFNSIDETFGYDSVVGPKQSALGFVLGQYDHPIINLLCNTKVGKYLFPEMYLNRGRKANYDPERYSQALIDEVAEDTSAPIFLSAHFLLPHYPWLSRDDEELSKFPKPEAPEKITAYQYRMMLKQVDEQFGDFIGKLKDTGVLDNAYVFLLSDHGDGFKFEKDVLQPGIDDALFDVETDTRGHATNVLNLGQSRIVLAARSYRDTLFEPEVVEQNASLMDVVPTIGDLLKMEEESKELDGISLLNESRELRQKRPLYLESGFAAMEVTADEITIKNLLEEGIKAYTVDKKGKLVVRDMWFDLVLQSKHRSVIRGDWQLSMIPEMGGHMVLTNISEKKWWPLAQYDGDAPWSDMLKNLCRHYKGEPGFDQEEVCLSLNELAKGNM